MMGDHRLHLNFTVTGLDGEVAKHDMWVNWHEDMPNTIAHVLDKKARSVGLNSFYLESAASERIAELESQYDFAVWKLEKAEAQLDAMRTHAYSGTSLSWRMKRIKNVLGEDK